MKRVLAKRYFRKYQELYAKLGIFVTPPWRRGKMSKCYKLDNEIWTAYQSMYDDEVLIWKVVENKYRTLGWTHTKFLKRRKVPEVNWWCDKDTGGSKMSVVDSGWVSPFIQVLGR